MTRQIKKINIPINRAEGDLEVQVEIEDGRVMKAWSSGTLFRGFEEMMKGRGALDGLVITPRICGVCSLTHLTAACEALDKITLTKPPDNALRMRNLCQMAEIIQSDIRQAVLMYMVDFANQKAYKNHPLGAEAAIRYAPLKGRAAIAAVKETKRLVELISIIGGQWPHTSFMVPGGVTSIPEIPKILHCSLIVEHFSSWYQQTILGCSIERWQMVKTKQDLDDWLDERPEHQQGELGFFLRFARKAGLDLIGRGPGRFLSYGSLTLPEETSVSGRQSRFHASGFAKGIDVTFLDPTEIKEDCFCSWFEEKDGPLHPFEGKTKPYASGQGGEKYSWVKAPRYKGKSAETGPLAEMIIDANPLFSDLVKQDGPSALTRELARIVRPAALLPVMEVWLDELKQHRNTPFYHKVGMIPDGEGAGMVQAARGALGHWIKVKDEKIVHYQVITPTAWNASPRDGFGGKGPWEEALIGTPVKDVDNPVEIGHVIRSFDPCLVCAVHTVQKDENKGGSTIRLR